MKPGIISRALLAAALAGTLGCRPVRGNGTNVLLVTYETTRADHLSAYGYARDTAPAMARLASEGVLFESHLTVSPRTNPSLASLMTSSYPQQHGVRNLLLPLEPENRTLAEALRAAGYQTYAIQTHPRLVRASGFAQGFDRYDDDVAAHPLADRASALAAAWIARASRGSRPWFAWVHLMDPHWTYEPPAPWRTRYASDDPRPWALYDDLRARRATIGPVIFQNRMPADEVASFVALYDGELRFTDEALAALLLGVEDAGVASRTLVVVTADHGESLGEHRYFFEHGDLGTEPEIHIPLVMRLPGTIPAGRRVTATERSIDVAPRNAGSAVLRRDRQELPRGKHLAGDSGDCGKVALAAARPPQGRLRPARREAPRVALVRPCRRSRGDPGCRRRLSRKARIAPARAVCLDGGGPEPRARLPHLQRDPRAASVARLLELAAK